MKCEGSKISEYLQNSRSAGHRLIDVGRRLKTPRSEVKDNDSGQSVIIRALSPSAPVPVGDTGKASEICTCVCCI